MRSTLRAAITPILFLSAFVVSCSGNGDDTEPPPKRDGGTTPQRDGGMVEGRDAGVRDGGDVVERDAGPRDGGGAPRDAGMALTPELVMGSHVQVAEGRVTIGTDTLADVEATFGAGTRTPGMNVRSYEWALSGNVSLAVWFANSSLGPVGTVNATDTVLWAAVNGGYTGTTPGGTGIGSTRADVESDVGLGMAPNEVPITSNPTGTLLQFFSRGALVALADDGSVRTITISRAYNVEPDGEIDPASERIRLSNGDVEGFQGLGNQGTRLSDVRTRLGEPDAEGDLSVQGQMLHTLSYAFIGIEIFAVDSGVVGRDRVGFMSIHAPYYGTAGNNGPGIGDTRADFESFLSSEGYGNAMGSSNPTFFCYTHNNAQGVGVSYSAENPPTVTSVTIPLLQCP